MRRLGCRRTWPWPPKPLDTGVIPKPLRAAWLGEKDVGCDQGIAEVVLVPFGPERIQAAKVFLMPRAGLEYHKVLKRFTMKNIRFTKLVHKLSSQLCGASPFYVLPTLDLQF